MELAAAALEDYYEQLLTEVNHELEDTKEKLGEMETTLATRIVAAQQAERTHVETHSQWVTVVGNKDQAIRELQAELRKLTEGNTALRLSVRYGPNRFEFLFSVPRLGA